MVWMGVSFYQNMESQQATAEVGVWGALDNTGSSVEGAMSVCWGEKNTRKLGLVGAVQSSLRSNGGLLSCPDRLVKCR